MLTLARAITRLNRLIGRIAAWAILPIFALLIIDVGMRYVVGRPSIWTSELTQLVFGVYAVIGGGYLLAERAHVNVDIVYGRQPRKRKALLDVITSFLFFLFLGVIMYQGIDLAWDSWSARETSQSIWNPPIWPVKVMIPVAGLLLLLQGIVRLIGDIRVLLDLPVDDDTFGAQATDEPSH
jgi:TRAP-type mannitol/chloroaromatic compound transport system permease small subunit